MAKTKSKSATYNPKNTWKYDLKKNGVLYLIYLDPIYISLDLQIYSDGGDFDGISGL